MSKLFFKLLLLILFLIFPFSSEKAEYASEKKTPPNFKITEFTIKSFSDESFFVTIESNSRTSLNEIAPNASEYGIEERFHQDDQERLNCILKIDNFELNLIKGTIRKKRKYEIAFLVYVDGIIPSGKRVVQLLDSKNKLLDKFEYEVPSRSNEIDSQPVIYNIFPRGGEPGDNITLTGKNFGNKLDDVAIVFLENSKEIYLPEIYTSPIFLGTLADKKKQESMNEIKFLVPFDILKNGLWNLDEWSFIETYITGKNLKLYLLINHRPSPVMTFTVVSPYWKLTAFIFTITFILIFLLLFSFIIKPEKFFQKILLDSLTNTYSLSKLQSFLWTIIGFGSYMYIAFCQGIILREGKLPEFSFALLGLMGISYGGLLASDQISRSNSLKLYQRKPTFKDLFCKYNEDIMEIDLPKFQLLVFTIIALVIYLFNLFWGNSLEGMPTIPESIHALLVTSQGGYLGGKYINDKVNNSQVEKRNLEESKNMENLTKEEKQ